MKITFYITIEYCYYNYTNHDHCIDIYKYNESNCSIYNTNRSSMIQRSVI